jgi:hypothetical protein
VHKWFFPQAQLSSIRMKKIFCFLVFPVMCFFPFSIARGQDFVVSSSTSPSVVSGTVYRHEKPVAMTPVAELKKEAERQLAEIAQAREDAIKRKAKLEEEKKRLESARGVERLKLEADARQRREDLNRQENIRLELDKKQLEQIKRQTQETSRTMREAQETARRKQGAEQNKIAEDTRVREERPRAELPDTNTGLVRLLNEKEAQAGSMTGVFPVEAGEKPQKETRESAREKQRALRESEKQQKREMQALERRIQLAREQVALEGKRLELERRKIEVEWLKQQRGDPGRFTAAQKNSVEEWLGSARQKKRQEDALETEYIAFKGTIDKEKARECAQALDTLIQEQKDLIEQALQYCEIVFGQDPQIKEGTTVG